MHLVGAHAQPLELGRREVARASLEAQRARAGPRADLARRPLGERGDERADVALRRLEADGEVDRRELGALAVASAGELRSAR